MHSRQDFSARRMIRSHVFMRRLCIRRSPVFLSALAEDAFSGGMYVT